MSSVIIIIIIMETLTLVAMTKPCYQDGLTPTFVRS